MKKILASLVFLIATAPVFAHHGGPHHGHHAKPHHWQHHRHHHHHRHWHNDHRWVAPLIIGGAVTYALTRPPTVVERPVIIEQPILDTVPGTNCTAWREIQQSDGTIVRERTCYQN